MKRIFLDEWMICLWYPVTSYVSNPSKPATFITNLWNELPADVSQREFPYQTSSMNLTVQGCVSCLRVLPCRTFATAATECPLGLGCRLQEHFNYESWPKWMAFTFTIIYYNVITLLTFPDLQHERIIPKHFLKVMRRSFKTGGLELWYIYIWYMPFCSGSDFTNMFHGNVLWSFGL